MQDLLKNSERLAAVEVGIKPSSPWLTRLNRPLEESSGKE